MSNVDSDFLYGFLLAYNSLLCSINVVYLHVTRRKRSQAVERRNTIGVVMLSLNQGCISSFIIFSLLALAVPSGIANNALSYFFGVLAYSFLIEMFGYIFWSWLEIAYYTTHPSWSETTLKRYKHYFLAWVMLVGTVLAITSVVQQATNASGADNLVAGELPLVIAFEFHAVILSIGFSVCLYKLCQANQQYSRFTDLFRRLTRMNFAFLGGLISLALCTVTIFLYANNQDSIILVALFTFFFLIPPLVIPPCVMWFFNPYTKLLKKPEEDISTSLSNNSPDISITDVSSKDEKGSKKNSGGSFCCFSETNEVAAASPAPAELELEPKRPELIKHDSQVNLNPDAVPPVML